MLKLLLFVCIYLAEKGNKATLFGTKGSFTRDSIYARSLSPQVVYLQYLGNTVNGIRPYGYNSHHPQQLSDPSYTLVKYSETPVKYPYAGVIDQAPITSTYGKPVSTNLPVVSSSFRPQTNTKPTGSYGPGTGATAPNGAEFGLGPLSTSYSNFLGTSWTGSYHGNTIGSDTGSGGLTETVPTAAVTINPTGTSGFVTKPGSYFGTGHVGGSSPYVNTGTTTTTGTVSLPLSSFTGYQQQTISENLGIHGSSGCPSYVSKPGATCLQVGPQPVNALPGNNIQSSGLHPSNQATYQQSNGTVSGPVTNLGLGSGGTSGIVGGSGINGFIPQTILPTGSVGSLSGLSGSSVTSLGSSGGGTHGTIGGTEAINFIPQTTSSLANVGSQSGLIRPPASSLGSGSGGTSGTIGNTGSISVTPQSTPSLTPIGSQSGLTGSSVPNLGLGSGGAGTIGSTGTIIFIPQTTPSLTTIGSQSGLTGSSVPSLGLGSGGASGTIGSTGTVSVIPQSTPSLTTIGSQSGLTGSSVPNLGLGSGGAGTIGSTGTIIVIPQTTPSLTTIGSQSGLTGSSVPSLGLGSGGVSGTIGSTGTVSVIPQSTPSLTTIGSQSGLIGSSVPSLGFGSGGASGAIGGAGTTIVIPQTTSSLTPIGSQSGLTASSVPNLGLGSGGASGTIASTGAVNVIPQSTPSLTTIGSQSGLTGSSVPGLGLGSGGASGTIASTGAVNVIPQSSLTTIGSQSGLTASGLVSGLGSGSGETSGTTGNTAALNLIPQTTLLTGSGGSQSGTYQTGSIPSGGVQLVSASSGGLSGATNGGLQTSTQSLPASGVQTIVCVTPEVCSHLISQPAATISGLPSVPANGVLCDPSGCRPFSNPMSEDYHIPNSPYVLRSSKNLNDSVLADTEPVSEAANPRVTTQS